jgi:hypothetical protein
MHVRGDVGRGGKGTQQRIEGTPCRIVLLSGV